MGSSNGRLRDELLNLWQFDSLLEAQVLIGDSRIDYNQIDPTPPTATSPPNEFTQAWITTHHRQPQAILLRAVVDLLCEAWPEMFDDGDSENPAA